MALILSITGMIPGGERLSTPRINVYDDQAQIIQIITTEVHISPTGHTDIYIPSPNYAALGGQSRPFPVSEVPSATSLQHHHHSWATIGKIAEQLSQFQADRQEFFPDTGPLGHQCGTPLGMKRNEKGSKGRQPKIKGGS